jgi:hypothetical protein
LWTSTIANDVDPEIPQALARGLTLRKLSKKNIGDELECYRPKLNRRAALDPDKCGLNPATICEFGDVEITRPDGDRLRLGTLAEVSRRRLAQLLFEGAFERPVPPMDNFIDELSYRTVVQNNIETGTPLDGWEFGWDDLVALAKSGADIDLTVEDCALNVGPG